MFVVFFQTFLSFLEDCLNTIFNGDGEVWKIPPRLLVYNNFVFGLTLLRLYFCNLQSLKSIFYWHAYP